MLGIRYMKTAPTTYVLHHSGGVLKQEGPGLSFWYFAPSSVIAAVPLGSVDVPFAFSEVAADFQAVTIQGQLTYRIADPRRIAGLLDFTVAPNGQHLSDDPMTLSDRLIPAAQVLTLASCPSLVAASNRPALLAPAIAATSNGADRAPAVTSA